MIKVSTRGDYGVVLMAYLARNYNREVVPLSEVAKNERLSFSYLQRIANVLRKKGLLTAKEGVGGGLKLSRPPGRISMGEVVETLEGPLGFMRCKSCKLTSFCPTRKPWQKIFRVMSEELNKISLKEIANG